MSLSEVRINAAKINTIHVAKKAMILIVSRQIYVNLNVII